MTKELSDKKIEAGWHQTFSTNNPFCPCDLKSFTKAVKWTERALNGGTTNQPAEDTEMSLIESQIEGLLEGDGASEDHSDVKAWLAVSGLRESLVARVHRAICSFERDHLGFPLTDDQIMNEIRDLAADGGGWPSDWIAAVRRCADLTSPQVAPAPGLSVAQEPKYTVSGSSIVNRETGEAIPEDEPVFVFRARDALGVRALTAYLDLIGEREPASAHADAVRRRIANFQGFAAAHPERMKWPDTGLAAPVQVAPAVVREFDNELGNRIRIVIEGPTSVSENILTPREVDELRRGLNQAVASAQVAPAPDERMRHIANEWADMATNGLQWVRNIAEGISTPQEALKNLTANMQHCRSVNDAPAAPVQAAPAGFKLVPVEPTAGMVKAAADAWLDCGSRLMLNRAGSALKAGIAAAAPMPTGAAADDARDAARAADLPQNRTDD